MAIYNQEPPLPPRPIIFVYIQCYVLTKTSFVPKIYMDCFGIYYCFSRFLGKNACKPKK